MAARPPQKLVTFTPAQAARIARATDQVLGKRPAPPPTGQRFDDVGVFLKIVDSTQYAGSIGRWLYEVEVHRSPLSTTKIGDALALNVIECGNTTTEMSGYAITPSESAVCGDVTYISAAREGMWFRCVGRVWEADPGAWRLLLEWANIPVVKGTE